MPLFNFFKGWENLFAYYYDIRHRKIINIAIIRPVLRKIENLPTKFKYTRFNRV